MNNFYLQIMHEYHTYIFTVVQKKKKEPTHFDVYWKFTLLGPPYKH